MQAYDIVELRAVAIKVHTLDGGTTAEVEVSMKYIQRECSIQRALNHPRVVPLLDDFLIDPRTYATIMPLHEGGDLATLLKERGVGTAPYSDMVHSRVGMRSPPNYFQLKYPTLSLAPLPPPSPFTSWFCQ